METLFETTKNKAIKLAKNLVKLELNVTRLVGEYTTTRSVACGCGESAGIEVSKGDVSVVVGICKDCAGYSKTTVRHRKGR